MSAAATSRSCLEAHGSRVVAVSLGLGLGLPAWEVMVKRLLTSHTQEHRGEFCEEAVRQKEAARGHGRRFFRSARQQRRHGPCAFPDRPAPRTQVWPLDPPRADGTESTSSGFSAMLAVVRSMRRRLSPRQGCSLGAESSVPRIRPVVCRAPPRSHSLLGQGAEGQTPAIHEPAPCICRKKSSEQGKARTTKSTLLE
jgi:hypothetical protein